MTNSEPKIIKCSIGPFPRPMPQGMFDKMPEVKVVLENGEEHTLFDFYPDEISFTESEFIGLTLESAKRLKYVRDLKYIQS